MINPIIRLIYYLLLNKGIVSARDPEAIGERSTLPITITESCANEVIQELLERVASSVGAEDADVEAKMRNFDWCLFNKLKTIASSNTNPIHIAPLKKSNFSGTFRRSK